MIIIYRIYYNIYVMLACSHSLYSASKLSMSIAFTISIVLMFILYILDTNSRSATRYYYTYI